MCFATFLSFFYLFYVFLTKTALDVFNCAAADPPDDPLAPTMYMDMSPNQECFRPGNWQTGLHVKMVPWAIAATICYTFAFPGYVYFKFSRNKKKIHADQLLLAQDRGEKPATNPNFEFRKKFSKLYSNYRPEKWYWILVAVGRKLGIALTALMFKRNPAFQLSVAMLVLFAHFTAHALNRPYLGMEERAAIVRLAAKEDYKKGERMLRKMAAFGEGDDISAAKKRLDMEEEAQMQIARALEKSTAYFVNLNWVETVFAVSAIFICLSGIMFSSGYFDNPLFAAQAEGLAIFTLVVVVSTIGFFFVVIGKEMRGHKKYRETKNKAKWTAFKKKAAFHANVLKINAANATSQETEAAGKLEAQFRGKKARDELRDRIMREGTEAQKAQLYALEARRKERREKALAEKKKRKKLKREKSAGRRTRRGSADKSKSTSGARLASWGSGENNKK